MSNVKTRADDDLVLEWMRLRSIGRTSGDIAAEYGVTPEAVRIPTNRALSADLKESGEPISRVLRSYWDREAGYRRSAA